MIAYLHRAAGGVWELTIVARPCNGEEFAAGQHILVANKRLARAMCKLAGWKPWNF